MRIVLELNGGLCNSKCIWCMLQYPSISKKIAKGFLRYDHFKTFLKLNKDTELQINPFGDGEPLIHPKFVQMMKDIIISPKHSLENIHTNFARGGFSTEIFDILTQFKNITVNFGGATKQTHFQNMKTNFDTVIGNLIFLSTTKHRLRSNVHIQAKMVITKRNEPEVKKLNSIIHKIDERIEFSTYPVYFDASDGSFFDKQKFIFNNLNADTPCRDNFKVTKEEIIVTPKINECHGIIPTVKWFGGVNICRRSRYGDGVVGNAFKVPLKDIFETYTYKQATWKAKSKEYINFCKYCS